MMQEWMEKAKAEFAKLKQQVLATFNKDKNAPGNSLVTTVSSVYEINLVPDVKIKMIKAQKMRNLVLFICIVVSISAVSVVLVLFGIKSGQDIAMSNQDKKLATLSEKLLGYDELKDLVTIQSQLDRLNDIANHKVVVSRVFGALSVMLPQTEDIVNLSELRVDLTNNSLRMEGQADARLEPLIDYRVLESFKKGAALATYDYGNYVDANGKTIPTYCIKEADEQGLPYRDGESFYAWWDLTIDGCQAARRGQIAEPGVELYYSAEAEVEHVEPAAGEDVPGVETPSDVVEGNGATQEPKVARVKIWRTPQYYKWYTTEHMALDGYVSGIEHFNSECTKYQGTMMGDTVRWTSTNDCMLMPDGLNILSSSNGRDESDNLVLRFTASAVVNEEFFKFANKHMIAIGPLGQNVTDSYMQIGNMFAQPATACADDDQECLNNSTNKVDE